MEKVPDKSPTGASMDTIAPLPIIDEALLEDYRVLQDEGQPDIVTEFIDIFLEDLPTRIEGISSAVEAKSADQIRSTAHALKGSAASIGAAQLAALCSSLEAIGKSGDPTGSAALLAEIEPAVEAARVGLSVYTVPRA
jgi:HPt (histidine-containing phosphotransfer) domain-containing protein